MGMGNGWIARGAPTGARAFVLAAAAALAAAPAPVDALQERERVERERAERERRVDRMRLGGPWTVWGDRPMLGVSLDMKADAELDGVRVASVLSGGPADEAGVREGDVIVSLDGHRLSDELDFEAELDADVSLPGQRLSALAWTVEEGEEVEIVVERDGETLVLAVTPEEMGRWETVENLRERMREVGERLRDARWDDVHWDDAHRWPRRSRSGRDARGPDVVIAPGASDLAWAFRGAARAIGGARAHGLELVELNPGLGAYFGVDAGVLIADVEDDSSLGLAPGDVVVAVDGRAVDDGRELARVLDSYLEGEELEFEIWRDGARTTVGGVVE